MAIPSSWLTYICYQSDLKWQAKKKSLSTHLRAHWQIRQGSFKCRGLKYCFYFDCISPSSVQSFTCNGSLHRMWHADILTRKIKNTDYNYTEVNIMSNTTTTNFGNVAVTPVCSRDLTCRYSREKWEPDTNIQESFYWCGINTIKYCRFCISRQTFSIKKSAFYTQILLHRVHAIALYDKKIL